MFEGGEVDMDLDAGALWLEEEVSGDTAGSDEDSGTDEDGDEPAIGPGFEREGDLSGSVERVALLEEVAFVSDFDAEFDGTGGLVLCVVGVGVLSGAPFAFPQQGVFAVAGLAFATDEDVESGVGGVGGALPFEAQALAGEDGGGSLHVELVVCG